MSESEVHESLVKADRWSKGIGVLFALGAYLLAVFLTEETTFSMAIAAFAGIGIRFYIPYHVSVQFANPEEGGIRDHPASGNYHHGAAGLALLFGPAAATVSQVIEPNTALAFAVGAVVGVPAYFALRRFLPSG